MLAHNGPLELVGAIGIIVGAAAAIALGAATWWARR